MIGWPRDVSTNQTENGDNLDYDISYLGVVKSRERTHIKPKGRHLLCVCRKSTQGRKSRETVPQSY